MALHVARLSVLLTAAVYAAGLQQSAARTGYGRQAPVRADHERVEALIEDIVLQMTVQEKARELDTTEGVNFLTNGAVDMNKAAAWLAKKGIGRVQALPTLTPVAAAPVHVLSRTVDKCSVS